MPFDLYPPRMTVADIDRTAHWQAVYATKSENEVSWFEENPDHSLDLISRAKAGLNTRIVDVGCGASRLVDVLVREPIVWPEVGTRASLAPAGIRAANRHGG